MLLFDRADGVKGHYCIGRRIGNTNFVEFWNKTGWAGHGQLFTSEAAAEFQMARLLIEARKKAKEKKS